MLHRVQARITMMWSPASTSSWMVQSNRATRRRGSGRRRRWRSPTTRQSGARPDPRAGRRQASSWWSARTVTPRWPAWRRVGHVRDVLATENDTRGGSRLTEVNELAASPTNVSSTCAATATTPLGKTPNTSRSRSRSRSWLVKRAWICHVVELLSSGRGVVKILRPAAGRGPASRRRTRAGRARGRSRRAPASARRRRARPAAGAGAARRRGRGAGAAPSIRGTATPRRPTPPANRSRNSLSSPV